MFYGASASIFETARLLRIKMTKPEKVLWKVLSEKKVKGFRFKSQHPIAGFIVDFYCHKAKLVIEVDGSIHNAFEQANYDEVRTYELEKLGLHVIRFSNGQVQNNIEHVIIELEKALEAKLP